MGRKLRTFFARLMMCVMVLDLSFGPQVETLPHTHDHDHEHEHAGEAIAEGVAEDFGETETDALAKVSNELGVVANHFTLYANAEWDGYCVYCGKGRTDDYLCDNCGGCGPECDNDCYWEHHTTCCGACEEEVTMCVDCWEHCINCSDICDSCSRCESCVGEIVDGLCKFCDDDACKDCGARDSTVCEGCGEHCTACCDEFCESCNRCYDCVVVCANCYKICEECDDGFCQGCSYCSDCNGDTACPDCHGTCFECEKDEQCWGCYRCTNCAGTICIGCGEKCTECSDDGFCYNCELCENCNGGTACTGCGQTCMECGAEGQCQECYLCVGCTTICEGCGDKCIDCDDGWCEGCNHCSDCNGGTACPGCHGTCEECGAEGQCQECHSCAACAELCNGCGDICDKCGEEFWCSGCDRCGDCNGETVCPDCHESCFECDSNEQCYECHLCENCTTICEDCGEHCKECDDDWCNGCNTCSACNGETTCPGCHESCFECDTKEQCYNCHYCQDCTDVCGDCGEKCQECDDDFCLGCGTCSDCNDGTACPECHESCLKCNYESQCSTCYLCENCTVICEDCGEKCKECDDDWCQGCNHCGDCNGGQVCPDCHETCLDCGTKNQCHDCFKCEDCVGICQDCGAICAECDDGFCENCWNCSNCNGETTCPECHQTCGNCNASNQCEDCLRCADCTLICENCSVKCDECDGDFCNGCQTCSDCHEGTVCPDCHETCLRCESLQQCPECFKCEECTDAFCADCGLCPDCSGAAATVEDGYTVWTCSCGKENREEVPEPVEESYNLWVGNVQVKSGNMDSIPCTSGTASYDPKTNTLTFHDAVINDGYAFRGGVLYAGIFVKDMSLTIKGKVTVEPTLLTDGKNTGILARGTTRDGKTLTLDGDITVKGWARGICGDYIDIVIAGGTLDLEVPATSSVGVLRTFNGATITLGSKVEVVSPEGAVIKKDSRSGYTSQIALFESADSDQPVVKAVIASTKTFYTVTFNMNGHGKAIAAVLVEEADSIERPEDPTAEGWVFGGWYTDAGCTKAYNFKSAVSKDLELFAKWTREKVNVTGVSLDQTSITCAEGGTVDLTATVSPADATNQTVTWKSEDTAVATVDSNGKVTAVAEGTTTITVTTNDGGKTDVCAVTVTKASEPEPEPDSHELVESFVNRIYTVWLERTPDSDGAAEWTKRLENKSWSGAQVAEFFVFSKESMDKNRSNEDFIDALYKLLMNRDPAEDPSGYAYWKEQMQNGMSKYQLVASFIASPEYTGICADYGIERGSVDMDTVNQVQGFVGRFYTLAMERDADQSGVDYWTAGLRRSEFNGASIAANFFFSKEMTDKHISDEKYIELLYQVMMGRASDEGGKAYWLGNMAEGMTKEQVLNGFITSPEFTGICADYGIERGSL